MSYRRRRGHDTWHYCTNCTLWPTSDYDTRDAKPTTGELCNQCRAKDDAGTCKK